jgi:sulfoxide reductase heme-binding subunit YedZ
VLHALTWAWWDQGFVVDDMLVDIWKRPFILVGVAAFLTMSLLAVTSTQGWMRRLGSKWQRLHQAIYLIGCLAILHYWWHKAGKNDLQTVMIYAAVLAALLLWRIVRWRIQLSRARP